MTNTAKPPIVVVGVKPAGRSRGAIRLAAKEACYRRGALLAIMAYKADRSLRAAAGRPLTVLHSADEERHIAESALRDAVVDALGAQAEQVALQAVPGIGGLILVDAARKLNAELVVLTGRDGVATVPGIVSSYVLRRAPCPVLVVPPAASEPAPSPSR
jgi:nucleotide-binding universal stress UspA family protein